MSAIINKQNFQRALKKRNAIRFSGHTDMYRLIHGAADGFSDLYVDVYTEIPVSLNKQQRKVLEELRNLEENSNHPDSTNFTNKVNKTRQ